MSERHARLLTPTQDLIMEVLSARDRLGENFWTFGSSLKRQLFGLQDDGLVTLVEADITEGRLRASITDKGREIYQTDPTGVITEQQIRDKVAAEIEADFALRRMVAQRMGPALTDRSMLLYRARSLQAEEDANIARGVVVVR